MTEEKEKAIFVGVIKLGDDERQVMEYLDELEFLAETAGAVGIRKFIQKVDKPDTRTYIRSGKLAEIKEYILENEIDLVIFDDELSPTQLRNIERELEIRILDRTNKDSVCEDTGRTRTVPVSASPADQNVDSPRKTERRYRHEGPWRNTDRNGQENHSGQDSET